jgi:hypothetical protein
MNGESMRSIGKLPDTADWKKLAMIAEGEHIMIRIVAFFACACLFIGCGHTNKQQSVNDTPKENYTDKQQNANVAPSGNTADGAMTYHIFVRDGRKHFAPQMIAAGETTLQWIFPVPESNTVGTLDRHSNGIAFLKFGRFMAKPESKVIAKDFSKEVYGPFDYQFSKNFSDNTIAYSKTRIAVIANVKTGEAFHANCGLSMDDYLLGIRFLDPQKNLFALVKAIDESNNGWETCLHVAKLEGQKFVDTKWSKKLRPTRRISQDFPLYNTWFVHDKKLFAYDGGQIICADGDKSVSHPFPDIFNANSKRFESVKDIAIHPNLPFGVIIDENGPEKANDIIVLRWDAADPKKKAEQIISLGEELEPLKDVFDMLSTDRMALAYQSFSPDGKWYVVGCIADNEFKSPFFIAIPVVSDGKEHGGFFDVRNTTILGQVKNMTSIAWTYEPTSYIVSDGELLRKWDLNELPDARVFVAPIEE